MRYLNASTTFSWPWVPWIPRQLLKHQLIIVVRVYVILKTKKEKKNKLRFSLLQERSACSFQYAQDRRIRPSRSRDSKFSNEQQHHRNPVVNFFSLSFPSFQGFLIQKSLITVKNKEMFG